MNKLPMAQFAFKNINVGSPMREEKTATCRQRGQKMGCLCTDGKAALNFLADIICQNERLQKLYGDQAYNDIFANKMREFGFELEKASRPESGRGFVPVAKRWIGERTIVWTNQSGDPAFQKNCQGLRIYHIIRSGGPVRLSGFFWPIFN